MKTNQIGSCQAFQCEEPLASVWTQPVNGLCRVLPAPGYVCPFPRLQLPAMCTDSPAIQTPELWRGGRRMQGKGALRTGRQELL
ncbi:hypothetical protein FKM82_009024 [Ascaphus truei]